MSDDIAGELAFVYGRLRRGGSNAFRMDGAEFIGNGTVQGTLYKLPGGPALVMEEAASSRVIGELYRLNPRHLVMLDELGGPPSEATGSGGFCRGRVLVHSLPDVEDSREAWTWAWTGAVDPAQSIQSGDWFDEEPPRPFDPQPLYPWFTWISLVCLLCFPLCLVGSFLNHSPSSLARLAQVLMNVFGALAPFAALSSLWLAKRRGESDVLFGCLFLMSFAASGLILIGLCLTLIEAFRR
ncbi:gamma-glutamylcyclotransferase [Luteolibacter arcticus]|uniref:Gamma-glutamylcyclotransferase n=1 Tax=Luteolibacter arcticus TaxID=1581411 RepID=A0ABT3GKE3_9BACT|nr:gamma-glutamylcyclotransferase [Luteolibacter arcticus]MCW1923995.1 gamma-glutamylcyclotransferase [Luteolibacter arcticus]